MVEIDSDTYELRRLLDERRVEYVTCDEPSMWYTNWRLAGYDMLNACFEEIDGLVPSFYIRNATPEQAVAATLGPVITGDTSDGYHTFNELYHHRAVLFSVIVRDHADLAWKSRAHHDGTMYDGMFIVGIETPQGQATYHYDIDPYWDMFECKELDRAPEWDGHTPDEAIERIATLGPRTCHNADIGTEGYFKCSECSASCSVDWECSGWDVPRFCPNCGAKVVDE